MPTAKGGRPDGRRREAAGALAGLLLAVAVASAGWAPLAGAAPPAGAPAVPPGLGKLQFNASSGEVEGAFVSFLAPASGAVLEDFSADITFFDAISVAGYVKENETFVGSLLKIRGSGVEAQVHDNPNAIIKLTLDVNTTASFDLAAGINASWGANNTSLLIGVDSSNRTGAVWWTCKGNATTLAGDGFSFDVAASSQCHVFFRSHSEVEADENAIAGAAENGRLMAEVFVGGSAENGQDVAAYGETSVVVAHTEGGVTVSLGPEGHRPSSVVVRFVPGDQGPPSVTVDGRAVRLAGSLEDALDPTDDGGEIEYVVVAGDDGNSVLVVSVPDSASHVVQVQTGSVAVVRDLTPAIVGVAVAMALTAGAAVVLFRRR